LLGAVYSVQVVANKVLLSVLVDHGVEIVSLAACYSLVELSRSYGSFLALLNKRISSDYHRNAAHPICDFVSSFGDASTSCSSGDSGSNQGVGLVGRALS
jgi:hypothetical protein